MEEKIRCHYITDRIASPTNPITITVIGAGGTGSKVMHGLARINVALLSMDHPGIFVKIFDQDTIQAHNIGRQNFTFSELGHNKAVSIIRKINYNFDFDWESFPENFNNKTMKCSDSSKALSNIYISCVDSIASREEIYAVLKKCSELRNPEYLNVPFYWMDIGNSYRTGQIYLSPLKNMNSDGAGENTKHVGYWEHLFKRYGEFMDKEQDKQTPSCSVFESLNRQDLQINSILAEYAIHLLWQMITNRVISYCGLFVNLETLQTSPIKL